MKELEKYFDIAREVHYKNVPLSESELEQLLANKTIGGTTQNLFKRFFKNFGTIKIMTITSIIAVFVAFLFIGTMSTNSDEKSDLKTLEKQEEKISGRNKSTKTDNLDINEKKNDKLAVLKIPDTTKNKKQDSANKIVYYNTSKINKSFNMKLEDSSSEKKSEDYTWNDLTLDESTWKISGAELLEVYLFQDSLSKPNKHSITLLNHDLGTNTLIRISNELEGMIKSYVNIDELKKISYFELERFYEALDYICLSLPILENERLVEKVQMYAFINKSLSCNPFGNYKYKSNGLYLEKNVLESLGIIFDNYSIKIPADMYLYNSENTKHIADYYDFKLADYILDKQNGYFIPRNFIYKCVSKLNIDNLKNKDNEWVRHSTELNNENNYNYDDIPIFKGEENTITQINFSQFPDKQTANANVRLAPLTVTGLTNSIFNHSAYMLNTKEEYFVNLYNFTSKKLEYELSITLNDKYKPIPDSIQNILYRNKAIESNKINALKYSKLIPIDIQNPYYGYTEAELLAKPSYSKITLWYYPDERFLSALPQDIREQIEEEMGLLEKIETGDLLPSEACEALGNKSSLLGLCSYTPSALTNVSIYPNPASDEVKLTFNLDSTRYVKVVLMDVTGNYQKDLLDWQEMGEGIKVIPLPLNQIHSGAYMLNIMTDKNERVIQKLIVK